MAGRKRTRELPTPSLSLVEPSLSSSTSRRLGFGEGGSIDVASTTPDPRAQFIDPLPSTATLEESIRRIYGLRGSLESELKRPEYEEGKVRPDRWTPDQKSFEPDFKEMVTYYTRQKPKPKYKDIRELESLDDFACLAIEQPPLATEQSELPEGIVGLGCKNPDFKSTLPSKDPDCFTENNPGRRLDDNQKQAVYALINSNNRGLLAMHGTGTGKTIIAAVAAVCLLKDHPDITIQVIVPASLQENIANDLRAVGLPVVTGVPKTKPKPKSKKKSTTTTTTSSTGRGQGRGEGKEEKKLLSIPEDEEEEAKLFRPPPGTVLLTTLESFDKAFPRGLFDCKNKFIIIDEAHGLITTPDEALMEGGGGGGRKRRRTGEDVSGLLGNGSSSSRKIKGKRAAQVLRCLHQAKEAKDNFFLKVLLLTATPMRNTPNDLYTLMTLMDGDLTNPEDEIEFDALIANKQWHTLRQAFNCKVSYYMLCQSDLPSTFPSRQDHLVWVPVNRLFAKQYRIIRASLDKRVDQKTRDSYAMKLRASTSTICGVWNPKIGAVVNKIHELQRLSPSRRLRILIYNPHTDAVEFFRRRLNDIERIRAIAITGKSGNPRSRADLIRRWNLSSEPEVFIFSKVGAQGLDFQGVDHVFITDPYWNQAVLEQAAGRGPRRQKRLGTSTTSSSSSSSSSSTPRPTVHIWYYFVKTHPAMGERVIDERLWDRALEKQNAIDETVQELLIPSSIQNNWNACQSGEMPTRTLKEVLAASRATRAKAAEEAKKEKKASLLRPASLTSSTATISPLISDEELTLLWSRLSTPDLRTKQYVWEEPGFMRLPKDVQDQLIKEDKKRGFPLPPSSSSSSSSSRLSSLVPPSPSNLTIPPTLPSSSPTTTTITTPPSSTLSPPSLSSTPPLSTNRPSSTSTSSIVPRQTAPTTKVRAPRQRVAPSWLPQVRDHEDTVRRMRTYAALDRDASLLLI